MKVKATRAVTQACLTLCDPMDCGLQGSSIHGILRARMLDVGSHSLLQGIFSNQGLNLGLLHCKQIILTVEPSGKLR